MQPAAAVVNCAAAKGLVPLAQVALTLQSYNELAVKPLRLNEVAVVLVVALVHVDDEFNL